jgi:hypothetical protein
MNQYSMVLIVQCSILHVCLSRDSERYSTCNAEPDVIYNVIVYHLIYKLCTTMHLVGKTLAFLVSLRLSWVQNIQFGRYKSNAHFNNLLPLHSDAILASISETNRLRCAQFCMMEDLCSGFLFNSNTGECKTLRCPIHGLKTSPDQSGWNYFNLINSKSGRIPTYLLGF